jgi:hypothetical protein
MMKPRHGGDRAEAPPIDAPRPLDDAELATLLIDPLSLSAMASDSLAGMIYDAALDTWFAPPPDDTSAE